MRSKFFARSYLSPKLEICAVLSLVLGCATDIQDPGRAEGSGGNGAQPGAPNGAQPGAPNGAQPGAPSGGAGSTTGVGGGSIIVAAGTTAMGPNQPSPMDLQGAPVYRRFMRLTNSQWERAVQDLLKLSAPSGLSESFEQPVQGADDFDNNEHILSVNQPLVDAYQAAAESLMAQVATDAALARIQSGTDPAAFITTFGRRAYRRPLTAAEISKYQALYTAGSTMAGTGSAFSKGATLVIQAMLQSPFFLYRSELAPTGAPLNGFEIASKLSFIIRGTTPSDADLDQAQAGKLDTAEGAAALATQMLNEPAAAEVFKQFHGSMLDLAQFSTIDKVGIPEYSTALNAEYEASAYLFFDRIFKKNLGLKDILTSTIGFVSSELAPFYGVAAPASGFAEVDLGPNRPGYFTQLPYLTLHGSERGPRFGPSR